MSATIELFEAWKKAKGYATDAAAGHALKVSKQAVNNWRSRNGNAEAHVIERMCRDLGRDPAPVMLQAFAEAAKSAEAARSLMRVARQLGAACVALLALVPLMLHSSPVEAAGARTAEGSVAPQLIHYAHFVRIRLMAVLAFLGLLPPTPRHQPKKLEPMRWNRPASCLVCP